MNCAKVPVSFMELDISGWWHRVPGAGTQGEMAKLGLRALSGGLLAPDMTVCLAGFLL